MLGSLVLIDDILEYCRDSVSERASDDAALRGVPCDFGEDDGVLEGGRVRFSTSLPKTNSPRLKT